MRNDEWEATAHTVALIHRELVRMADHLHACMSRGSFVHSPMLIRDAVTPDDDRFYTAAEAAAKLVHEIIHTLEDEDVLRPEFTEVVTTAVLAEWVACVALVPNMKPGRDYMCVVRAVADGMWGHSPRMLPQSLNIWDSRVRCALRPLTRIHDIPAELLGAITELVGSSTHETVLDRVFNLLEHNPAAGELITVMAGMDAGDRGYLETLINCLYNANVAVSTPVIEALSCLAKRDVADIALVTTTVYNGYTDEACNALLSMVDVLSQPDSALRTVKLSALSRNIRYPEDTDWGAVIESFEHTGTPELVEQLFGARRWGRWDRLVGQT